MGSEPPVTNYRAELFGGGVVISPARGVDSVKSSVTYHNKIRFLRDVRAYYTLRFFPRKTERSLPEFTEMRVIIRVHHMRLQIIRCMFVCRVCVCTAWAIWRNTCEFYLSSPFTVASLVSLCVAEGRPKTTNLHRKPSSAWRKERRRDPIQSEALDMSAARVHHSRPSVIVPTTPQAGKQSSAMSRSHSS